jgi:hypothetical protein
MSENNQLIEFVKWVLKWVIILVAFVAFCVVTTMVFGKIYEYLSNTRHVNNIEVKAVKADNKTYNDILKEAGLDPDEYFHEYIRIKKTGADFEEHLDDIFGKVPEKSDRSDLMIALLSAIDSGISELRRKHYGEYISLQKKGVTKKEINNHFQDKTGFATDVLFEQPLHYKDTLNETKCDEVRSIYVSIKNNSKKTIKSMNIEFEAFLPRRSSNILDWRHDSMSSDYIIEPDSGAEFCISLPIDSTYLSADNLDDSTYVPEIKRVEFKK